jgi:hypothetical protein
LFAGQCSERQADLLWAAPAAAANAAGVVPGPPSAGLAGPAPQQQQQQQQQQQPVDAAGLGAAAASTAGFDALLLQPLVQPQVMVTVTGRSLPSMEQTLALLAAPMPAGSTRRAPETYLEVSTFTSRGPQGISPHKVMFQLAVLGLPSKMAEGGCLPAAAAAALPGSMGVDAQMQVLRSVPAATLAADLQALLGHLAHNMRRRVDVGRVVVCVRLDAAVAAGEPGLVIATTAGSKEQATSAVRGLVNQLALVYA